MDIICNQYGFRHFLNHAVVEELTHECSCVIEFLNMLNELGKIDKTRRLYFINFRKEFNKFNNAVPRMVVSSYYSCVFMFLFVWFLFVCFHAQHCSQTLPLHTL